MSAETESYARELFAKIPVSQSLGVKISGLSTNKVVISAPLEENINYEGTAFGGSLNTVAILSCYLMLHHFLKSRNLHFSSLVIQSSSIDYLRPTDSDFVATCRLPEKKAVDAFIKSLKKKGKARMQLVSEITCMKGESPRVHFTGNFVVTSHK